MTGKINRTLILAKHQEFETDRLILRKLRLEDAADLLLYHGDETTAQLAGFEVHKTLEDAQMDILEYGHQHFLTMWGLVLKSNEQLIGDIELGIEGDKADFYFCLNQDFRAQGLTTEAASCLRDFYFDDLDISVITGDHFLDNKASGRVMEKLGMKHYGQYFDLDERDQARLTDYYALTREDFLEKRY
ncbi:MAG: GNAT family N-acetyltransferase [Streptococcaceae bacterium]|jgi:ribosomal-protein-alanine N-acetyltransferase|nr:GNAT family N-acetyltransferase [Streptococcaceae bacterium]